MPVRGPALFLKARSAWWLPVLCVVAALVTAALPDTLAKVPLRDDVQVFPKLAAGSIPAGLAYLAMRSPGPLVERNPLILRVARFIWWPTIVLCLTACSTLPLLESDGLTALAVGRNAILLVSLGTLSGLLFGYEFAWVSPLAIVGITAVFGTESLGGDAYPWAVLDQPPDDVISWVVTLVFAVAAWSGYAMHDLGPIRLVTLNIRGPL